MKLYLASGLQNRATVSQIAQDLRERGYVITYDWTAHGSVQDASDEEKAAVAMAELGGVLAAELVVAILPGGRGTHVEIGAALGAGIPVIIVVIRMEDLLVDGIECVFYRSPGAVLLDMTADTHIPLSERLREWMEANDTLWAACLRQEIAEARAKQATTGVTPGEAAIDVDAVARLDIARGDAFRRALEGFDKSLLIDLIAELSRADTPDELLAWLTPRARLHRARAEMEALSLQMQEMRAPLHDGSIYPCSREGKRLLGALRQVGKDWQRAHDEAGAALEEVCAKGGGLPR